ncbi:DUF362 domain-containing protein [Candidatus Cloacimonadaceae bacterium]
MLCYKILMLLSCCAFCLPIACAKQESKPPAEVDSTAAVVYYSREISPQAVQKLYNLLQTQLKGKIAIKLHFGEEGNKNLLDPNLIKPLCKQLNATLVETNVLYGAERGKTESHIALARRHGFDFAPIDILDSEGNLAYPARGKHFSKVYTGSHFPLYDGYLIYSHFKGHGMAGFGGAIKNIAMGLASKEGKRFQHSGNYPLYDEQKCIQCGLCESSCPEDAITLNPVNIDHLSCIACGKCVSVCPEKVYSLPAKNQDAFMERLVEYAQVLTEQKPMVYINVLANISSACDCMSRAPKPFLPDLGIVASTDIVAVEAASHDLVDRAHNCKDAFLKEISVSGKRQISYAHELGMGNLNYRLVEVK